MTLPGFNGLMAPRGLVFLAGSALLLSACGQPEPAPDPAPDAPPAESPDPNTLTPEGLGEIRIGMSRADLERAVGALPPEASAVNDPMVCTYGRPASAPENVLVMLENDRVTRITLIRESPVRTADDIGLGDEAARVLETLGSRAETLPHKYVEAPAQYVDVWTNASPSSPDARGYRYEVSAEGRVSLIHAGTPSILYVEGCA